MSENPGAKPPRQKGIYDNNGNGTNSPVQKSVKRVGMYDRPKRSLVTPQLLVSIMAIIILLIAVGYYFFVMR